MFFSLVSEKFVGGTIHSGAMKRFEIIEEQLEGFLHFMIHTTDEGFKSRNKKFRGLGRKGIGPRVVEGRQSNLKEYPGQRGSEGKGELSVVAQN